MKKPWPADAVIIVASIAGTELRDQMQAVVMSACRDCGRRVAADSLTIASAVALRIRKARPVDFMCVSCAILYEVATHIVDHRKPLNRPLN